MVLLWPLLLCCREPVGATVARPAPARLSFSGGVAGGAAPGCVTPVSLSAPEVAPTAQLSPALPPCPACNPPLSPARPCCRFCSQVWHSLLHLHLCNLLSLRPSRILSRPRPLQPAPLGGRRRRPRSSQSCCYCCSAAISGLAQPRSALPRASRRAPSRPAALTGWHLSAARLTSSMSFASKSACLRRAARRNFTWLRLADVVDERRCTHRRSDLVPFPFECVIDGQCRLQVSSPCGQGYERSVRC